MVSIKKSHCPRRRRPLLLLCYYYLLPASLTEAWIPGLHRHNRLSTSSLLHKNQNQNQRRRPRRSSSLFALSAAAAEETTAATALRELYPPCDAVVNGTLQRESDDETATPINLRYQIYGKPNATGTGGLVGLFLHGGPGAGCFPNHARFFDLQQYDQVVLLDQRGCGQSTPLVTLEGQTLEALVEDCEALREHLELEQWDVVLGGSWGTTLAIAYGQHHPSRVRSMVLRGVCTMRPQEVDWLFSSTGGAAQASPDQWASFAKAVEVDPISPAYPREALHAYYDRLWTATNETERTTVARAWMQWEFFNSVSYKLPPSVLLKDSNATRQALQEYKPSKEPVVAAYSPMEGWTYQTPHRKLLLRGPQQSPNGALSNKDLPSNPADIGQMVRKGLKPPILPSDPERITEPWPMGPVQLESTNSSRLPAQQMLTCYYSTNQEYCCNYTEESPSLLENREGMAALQDIPCVVVQGGSDPICPPDTALDLLEAWPTLNLRMPLEAGHSMYDPLLAHEVIQATDALAGHLRTKEAED